MNQNLSPIIDATERRWRAGSAPGRCDDTLTALCLDISRLAAGDPVRDGNAGRRECRYVLLARHGTCNDGDICELYVADQTRGRVGSIDGHVIGARLIWDARLGRDCYFLWVWCDRPDNVIWEGCRRAITPVGKYGVHRNGNVCPTNTHIVHLAIA